MKTNSSDHLSKILRQKGSPLQKIFEMYEAHKNLKETLQQDLPEAYRKQVDLLFYRGGIMTLGVSNSAMLTRINYSKQDLLDQLKKKAHWAGLREIKVKISV